MKITTSKLSIKKINRLSPIELVKNTGSIKAKSRELRVPKIIGKVFCEEGYIVLYEIEEQYKQVVIHRVIYGRVDYLRIEEE